MNAPRYLFYNYQWNWLTDPSPFKIGLWARQTGKDYTCAAEAVFDSLARPNNHWLIIACGERQARESLEQAKNFALQHSHSIASISRTEIRFTNGSRITALPAKPETNRGYSANLILTEFAFHDHPDEIWRSVFPTLTNPLKAGPRKLRIISTPNGHNNKFAQLWTSDPNPNLNPNLNLNLNLTPHPASPFQISNFKSPIPSPSPIGPSSAPSASSAGSRFKTSVTLLVQDIGNTSALNRVIWWLILKDAMETS